MDWVRYIREAQSRLRKARGKSPEWAKAVPMLDANAFCTSCRGDRRLHKQESVVKTVRYPHFEVLGLAVISISNRHTCLRCGHIGTYKGGPHEVAVPLWVAERGLTDTLSYLGR